MSHPTYDGTADSQASAAGTSSDGSTPVTSANNDYTPSDDSSGSSPSASGNGYTASGYASDGYGYDTTGSDGYSYDKEQTSHTEKTMRDEAVPTNRRIANQFDAMHDAQTEKKWGVEEAAVAYKKNYQDNLMLMRDEFNLLGDRIEKFVEALQSTVKAMEADEEDAETVQMNLQEKLKAAAMPSNAPSTSASPSSSGPGPYSYDASTSSLPPINGSNSQKG